MAFGDFDFSAAALARLTVLSDQSPLL